MACLKCGKETLEDQVFCCECKEVMDRYPVKPGTPVQLPQRTTAPIDKKPARRKKRTPEQINAQLRTIIRWLFAASVVLLAVVCYLAFRLFGL